LVDAGEPVVVLDNMSTGFRSALPPQSQFVIGDVGERGLLTSLIKTHRFDAVIHFAGSIVVPESVRQPLDYYKNNTANSRDLIAACIEGGVEHFIFSSTAAVYGNPAQERVPEDAPLAPVSPYGWSKLMTEVMLRDAGAAHGLNHIILRYFNVAGADPNLRSGQSTPNATHLIKVAVQTALGLRPELEVFGTDYPTPDGTCVRDYIHVTDLARAHRDALTYLRRGGSSTTLNCGYGQGYSVRQVVEGVRRSSGQNFEIRMGPRRAGDPASIVAEASRIRDLLGWTPRWNDLDAIIRHAIAWESKLMEQDGRAVGRGGTR
jgi:UDP-glucose 4-epimerase